MDLPSRPVVAGDYATAAIAFMAATISGYASRVGSRAMQAELVRLLESACGRVLGKPTVGVVIPQESWASGIGVLSDDTHAEIREQIDAFLAMLDA